MRFHAGFGEKGSHYGLLADNIFRGKKPQSADNIGILRKKG